MGRDLTATLCFGVPIEEDNNQELYDMGLDEWWRTVNNYKPIMEIYNEDGDYLPGVNPTKEEIALYHKYEREWDKNNPCPVKLVVATSFNDTSYIVTVKESEVDSMYNGKPQHIPDPLPETDEWTQRINAFCSKYGVIGTMQPSWLLSAFYG